MTFYVKMGGLTLPIVFKYLNATSARGSLDLMFSYSILWDDESAHPYHREQMICC